MFQLVNFSCINKLSKLKIQFDYDSCMENITSKFIKHQNVHDNLLSTLFSLQIDFPIQLFVSCFSLKCLTVTSVTFYDK